MPETDDRATQAKNMYETERASIEAQYWDARDQVQQRLLSSIEERRRKLREEKEGGEVISGEFDLALMSSDEPKTDRRHAS